MVTQSDLERYLWKVEERILTAGMNGPRSDANAHSQADVATLLAMLKELLPVLDAHKTCETDSPWPTCRIAKARNACARLAGEAMGE